MSFNVPQSDKKRVVIVGGGFGGLKLANKLRKSNYQVVLIDRNNYHQFPPLIYQIASAGIEPSSISFPLILTCDPIFNMLLLLSFSCCRL